MSSSPSGEFFKRNSSLFTVLGVFAAISVYFTQLELNSRWQRLGLVSSFTIFIVVAIAIQQNITPPASESSVFDYVAGQQWQRKGLAAFYVSFYAVVLSISAVVVRYSSTLFFLFGFWFFILGVRTTSWLISSLDFPDEFEDKPMVGESKEFPLMAAYIVRNSMYTAILGGGGLVLAQVTGRFPVEDITSFQLSSPIASSVFGFLSGLLASGATFAILFTGLVCLHFQFLKMKERGTFENFAEFYKQTPWSDGDSETE